MDFKFLSLSEADAQSFVTPLFSYLPPEVLQHGRVELATRKLLLEADEIASPEACALRAERFYLHGHENGRLIIGGLRFRKLNPAFPFVHFLANFSITEDDIARFQELTKRTYGIARPRGFTIRQAPDLFKNTEHEKWSHTLWARTRDIPEASLPSSLSAAWNTQVDFYPDYEREYEEFFKLHSETAEYLKLESLSDLNRQAQDGLLLSVYDSLGWGGVIGGVALDFYGFPCLYIFEIFLAKRLRGKGIARTLQASFIRRLSDRFSHIYGHINDANLPSLRTAHSLNRKVVESEYFFRVT
jgi:GNAT superfamily N-acetyltransferase